MIITRFAPSPTGYLHIGGLRTALFNFLYARKNGGKFLLRIEDTDLSRNSEDATNKIIEAFKWTGLKYDNDEVVYQSKRLDIYRKYIDILLKEKKAYFCYMTKEEIEENKKNKIQKYSRKYRDFNGTPPSGVNPTIRIKAPIEGEIVFHDILKGKIKIQAKELDDYIIARSDGSPTYNFVVSIDDALMNITHVIRGDDHLINTPKQILIYDALGFVIPTFCHIPMILNLDGKKLSKRDGALDVMEYKNMGVLPQALLNFLLRLGFSYADKEIFSQNEMLDLFDLSKLNNAPSIYNESKLYWLNNHYIRETSLEEFENLLNIDSNLNSEIKQNLYEAIKERSSTLIESKNMLSDLLNVPLDYEKEMLNKIDREIFKCMHNLVEKIDFSSKDGIKSSISDFAKTANVKSAQIFMTLRFIIFGKHGGIGVDIAMLALGKNEIEKRIKIVKEKFNL